MVLLYLTNHAWNLDIMLLFNSHLLTLSPKILTKICPRLVAMKSRWSYQGCLIFPSLYK
jgi:hypothetical protein